MRNWKACSILAVVLAASVGTITVPAQTATYGNRNSTWIPVSVFLNVPIAGADVAVYDRAGNLLFQHDDATNDQGVYPARVAALPRDFRVAVTFDGNAQQDPTLGSLGRFTLSADVRCFDPVNDIVYIDPATTLVSRVLDRDPQLGIHRARALVRHFLGLPEYASLGVALRQSAGYQSPYFSEAAFVKQARQAGGMDPLLNHLVSQLLKPSFPTHPFVSAPTAALGNPLAFIGTNLATGALTYLGGQGVGWVLAKAGLVTPGATAAQIEAVQKSLADLQSSVANLSAQVEALNKEFTDIKYQNIVRPALERASDVNHVEEKLSYFADQCPPLVESTSVLGSQEGIDEFCIERQKTIRSQLTDIRINGAFNAISGALLDNPTNFSPGILHLGSQLVGQSVRFFRPADSTKLFKIFEYWKSAQTQAANLQVELAHLEGAQNSPGGMKELRDFLGDPSANPPTLGKFQNTLAAEQELVFPAVPVDAFINTRDKTMWLTYYDGDNRCRGVSVVIANSGGLNTAPGSIFRPPPSYLGLQNWDSPTLDQAKALIYGWTGASPNEWLIENTKTVAPDSPPSPSFVNIVQVPCEFPPAIWTTNFTGQPDNRHASTLNLKTGAIADVKNGFGNYRWVVYARPLKVGEQYYWYPGQ